MSETWLQIITIIISNLGVILWFRKESREDWARCQNTLDAIQDEIKDFHKRLLEIEVKK